jgi:hypothetical protein
MKRSGNWAAIAAMVLVAAADPGRVARGQALSPGFELERSGRYADAATVYLGTVRADPVNIPALLGLERTLFVLNRMSELLPLVQRARARSPESGAIRSLELRVYAALNQTDSLEAVARRWARTAPRSDAPYREWGLALADRRQWDEARRAYLAGRRALDDEGGGTLAIELAELEQRAGNWEAAAAEWARAVTRSTDAGPNAASQLAETPSALRERVARVLTAPEAHVRAKRVGAEVLLTWGQPIEAWRVLEPTLADSEAQAALRRFADLAGALTTPEGHRVRGLALNRWADLVPSPAADRARAEAVRELLEAGDRLAARQVLEGHSDASGDAQAALLQLLIADGQLDVAEKRLAAEGGGSGGGRGLTADDRAALRLALAKARVARGELERADAALAGDSNVAAIAQHGWIALYRGNLKGAMEAFRLAGPYATDRAAATERTAMMALLQRVQEESNAELGAALLTLARGDSAAAIVALRRAGSRLPVHGGRLEVLLLAGQVAARAGGVNDATAIALFDEIVRADPGGGGGGGGGESAAPAAAELEWSRLLVRSGRGAEAIPHLEHLILTYPNSAFVPEARRVLERARGVIPKS